MSHSEIEPAHVPVVWPSLIVCALVAVLIDLGTLHRGQHADSLICVQMSLYRWTPFYWELDRVGSIVPLLALPFQAPLANLLVQGALYTWFTLAAFVLLARYMLRNATYPLAAFVSAAGFLAFTPAYYRSEIIFSTYGVWLSLALTALLLIEPLPNGRVSPQRLALALLFMILAHWAYCTAAVFLGPLVLFRALFCARQVPMSSPDVAITAGEPAWLRHLRQPLELLPRKVGFVSAAGGVSFVRRILTVELQSALGLLAAGCTAGFVIRHLFAVPANTQWGTLPVRQWPVALIGLWSNTWNNLAPQYWPYFLASIACTGCIVLFRSRIRGHAVPSLKAAGALAAAALTIACFMATRKWVQLNLYMFRYLVPAILFLQAALVIAGVAPLYAAARRWCGARGLYLTGTVALALAAVASYGYPSLTGVRNDLAVYRIPALTGIESFEGIRESDVIDAGCTHIAGNNWKVWPAVFNTNLALHDRGEKRVVWGITLRDKPTRDLWSRVPLEDLCIAVAPGGDPEADFYLKEAGFPPLVVVERRPTAWILRPRSQLAKLHAN